MATKENILDAWIMVEHLSEGDFKKDSVRSLNDLQGRDFHSMFLDEIDKRKKEFKSWKEGGIVVYFDVFNFQKVAEILREEYHLDSTDEEIRTGDKFSFALCFDEYLNFLQEMTFL